MSRRTPYEEITILKHKLDYATEFNLWGKKEGFDGVIQITLMREDGEGVHPPRWNVFHFSADHATSVISPEGTWERFQHSRGRRNRGPSGVTYDQFLRDNSFDNLDVAFTFAWHAAKAMMKMRQVQA